MPNRSDKKYYTRLLPSFSLTLRVYMRICDLYLLYYRLTRRQLIRLGIMHINCDYYLLQNHVGIYL